MYFLAILAFLFLIENPASAALLSNINCISDGNCQLNDFAKVAVNVASWILGVTGSLALLAFIYGGALFLISSGSSEQVNKGKQAIVGAVIGLVIVFTSYMIIGFVFRAIGADVDGTAWAQTGWFANKGK